jgi:predicted phosphatase|tara:strand:+ start:3383 stop:3901 length:519 start_codon:yes stop_codon:yes gene_type:complete
MINYNGNGVLEEWCKEHDVFMFDLDRTVFDTYTKKGEPIWAKQMIQPLKRFDEDLVVDDCESECVLQPGIRSVLMYLKSKNKKVGFISRGGIYNLEYENQPSVLLLQSFEIYDYFSFHKLLFYKDEVKANHLSKIGKCVFFDDMEKDLKAAKTIPDVKVVDRNGFDCWEDLL